MRTVISTLCILGLFSVWPQQAFSADIEAERVRTQPDPYEQFFISQAIRAGDFVFVSGQVGMDLDGLSWERMTFDHRQNRHSGCCPKSSRPQGRVSLKSSRSTYT